VRGSLLFWKKAAKNFDQLGRCIELRRSAPTWTDFRQEVEEPLRVYGLYGMWACELESQVILF